MIGAHHLAPLCSRDQEAINCPIRVPNGVAATNGKAALILFDGSIPAVDFAGWAEIERLEWVERGSTDIDALRAFIRRDVSRETLSTDGQFRTHEPVGVFGVVVDARLLRRYLPGTHERVKAYVAKNDRRKHWRNVEAPALRLDGVGWRVIIMAIMLEPQGRFA